MKWVLIYLSHPLKHKDIWTVFSGPMNYPSQELFHWSWTLTHTQYRMNWVLGEVRCICCTCDMNGYILLWTDVCMPGTHWMKLSMFGGHACRVCSSNSEGRILHPWIIVCLSIYNYWVIMTRFTRHIAHYCETCSFNRPIRHAGTGP
jgi:hypothetical protein